MDNYELTDIEDGVNLNKLHEKIKKEMEKKEKPNKNKPEQIFVNFKKKFTNKKKKK